MKKRVFCCLLALCMMMSLMPGAVFAEEPATEEPAYEETVYEEPAGDLESVDSEWPDGEPTETLDWEAADWAEESEPTDIAEPVNAADPMEEFDSSDETEPTEEAEPMDDVGLADEDDLTEAAEPMDDADPADTAEPTDEADLVDTTDTMDDAGSADVAEPMDEFDPAAEVEPTQMADPMVSADPVEVADPVMVVFKPDPEDAAIIVYLTDEQDEKMIIEAEEDGSYLLFPGVYAYDVSAAGFYSVNDVELQVYVSEEPIVIPCSLTMIENPETEDGEPDKEDVDPVVLDEPQIEADLEYEIAEESSEEKDSLEPTEETVEEDAAEEQLDVETETGESTAETVSEAEGPEDEEAESEANTPKTAEDDQEVIDRVEQNTSAKQEAVNATVSSGTCGDNLTWILDDAGVLTISGTGRMDDALYCEIDGLEWWELTPPWFELRAAIRTVNIQAGATSIGDYAFYECSGLTSIRIPDSVTIIGDNAFRGCSALMSITIPNSVTSIGNKTFYECSRLTSIAIPGSVTSIGGSAFYHCSSLTSVKIPSSVITVGYQAFRMCVGLTSAGPIGSGCNYEFGWTISIPDNAFSYSRITSVTIPDSVTSIGESAFYGCSALTSIRIPDRVTSIGDSAFYACNGFTSVTIPNSVTSIGERAFCACKGLTSITIPDSVTSIGAGAFYACTGITSIMIPDGVTSISDEVFYYCIGLTSITIPNSVTSIGQSAFDACSGLTSITIPEGVTSIGSSAFSGCSGLTSITIPDSVSSIDYGAFRLCSGLTSVKISSSLTSISDGMFSGCSGLTSITIPNSVTSIGDYAFYNCSGLTSITIPDSVTVCYSDLYEEIGVFTGCSGLTSAGPIGSGCNIEFGWTTAIPDDAFLSSDITSITIPEGVTSIGERAFYHCTSLTSVKIPDSVTSIEYEAFKKCGRLKSAGPIGSGCNFEFGWTISIPDNAFSYSRITSITIPEGVTNIGNYAFYACSGLTSIIIPGSVTSIGNYAFSDCSGLTSAGPIGSGCSIECGWTTTIPEGVFSGCSGLTSITIPSSVTSIGEYAFADCSGLTSITIPEGVTSIGSSAFSGCSGLTSITIPEGVTSIGSSAFSGCSGLTSITLPDRVTSIGSVAFSGCSGLTSITIPGSVTSIGDYAFHYCRGLTSITISEGVTNIGERAFSDCTGLMSITIPASMISIGDSAFAGDRQLTSIIFAGSPPLIANNCFSGVTANAYYSDDESWEESNLKNYNGTLTWIVYYTGSPAVVVVDPMSKTVMSGAKASFYVSATGNNLSYQWQVYNTSTGKWANSGIASAKTAALSFTANIGQNGLQYRCAVTNNAGTVYSREATLTVIEPTVITDQPKSITVTRGTKATFIVRATGVGLSYQWQVRYGYGSWDNSTIASAKMATLSFTADTGHDGNEYRCAVTNNAGTVYSNAATLTVTELSVITDQPKSITVTNGAKATFTVAAMGSDLSYQWQVYDEPTKLWESSSIASAKTATLSFTANSGHNGLKYRCAVTNSAGTVYSDVATLTVTSSTAKPTITKHPASTTVNAGTSVTFTVTATGTGLNYQWQVYDEPTKLWENSSISSAKTATLSFTANSGHNGLKYRCAVTNSAGTVYSDIATLTVTSSTAKPTITKQPASATVSAGTSVTFTVTATGSGLSYQWQVRANNDANWSNSGISSAKTAAMTFAAPDSLNGYQYRCMVKNSAGTVYSNVAYLTVNSVATAKPTITRQPASANVTAGAKVTLTVTATGGGLSYQWQVRANSDANWSNSTISSAKTTTMVFTPSDSLNGYQYRCAVKNSFGTTYSNVAVLTISSTATAKPTITRQPASASVNAGSKVTLVVTATGGGLSYQWQVRANSSANWSNSSISSAKTTTMVFTPSDSLNGYQYRCAVKNSYGTTYSNVATLTVKSTATAAPTVTTQPKSASVTTGAKASFQVVASGGGLSYQWQVYDTPTGLWENSSIASAKSNTLVFTTNAGQNGLKYRCLITNSKGSTYSNTVTLTVK